MGRNVLKSCVQGASFRIIFQVLFRCITFVLNAWILRRVGADILGVMNVRLLLLESTVVFLSKEPCMKACQTNSKTDQWPQIINQIWLTVPACSVICIPVLYVWLNILSPTTSELLHQYTIACYIMALSCVIDQFTNSPLLVATSFCFVRLTVVLDTMHIIFRTILFVFLINYDINKALMAFAIAQIAASMFYTFAIYAFFWWYIKEINHRTSFHNDSIASEWKRRLFCDMDDFKFISVKELFPYFMKNDKSIFDKNLSLLTMSFTKQCIVKQILTEGERYVMTLSPVLTFSEQATYDVVNNLGSLAARFVFRPIEESGYFYFTQMIQRDEVLIKQDKKSITESAEVLSELCHIVTSIGVVAVVFGQAYSSTLLYLYGGSVLTSSSLPTTLLQWHCVAILLLAINGVTECYVFATMNSKQLDRYNYLMVFFSIMFLIVSYGFTYVWGPVGFIYANCINMSVRISHSVYYIIKKYEKTEYKPLRGLFLGPKFSVVLLTLGILVKWSEIYSTSILTHIVIGVFCLMATLLTWAVENKLLLKTGLERCRQKSVIKLE